MLVGVSEKQRWREFIAASHSRPSIHNHQAFLAEPSLTSFGFKPSFFLLNAIAQVILEYPRGTFSHQVNQGISLAVGGSWDN